MTTLYVGRFNSVVTQEHLREALRVHGAIASVSLIQNFAFVTFEDPSSAEKAYRAHRARGLQLCGGRVQVNWAKQQERHQPGADLRKVLESSRRLGGGSRPPPLHNANFPRSFCTVCKRPGHPTENCWYGGGPQTRVPFVRPVRGGEETRRPGLGGEGQRANAAPPQVAELSKRGREKSAPKGNVRGRGSSDKGGDVKANLPVTDAGGVEKLEKTPPRSRSADPASERVSSHKQKGGSRGSERRGRSISRESGRRGSRRPASLSVTRCSDSQCSCQRSFSPSPPPSLSCSSRSESPPPSRGRRSKGRRSLDPPERKVRSQGDGANDMHAPRKGRSPSRASSGGKSCSSGRRGSRDESGGSVSPWQGGANGGGVKERKRKREEEEKRTGAVRKVPRTETADLALAKPDLPAVHTNGPLKPAPQNKVPMRTRSPLQNAPESTPPKRGLVGKLREGEMLIPRITEWWFDTLEMEDDGEINSAKSKRPPPDVDLPARLRPVLWRNVGREVKRGLSWKKGLEVLGREFERPKGLGEEGTEELGQGFMGGKGLGSGDRKVVSRGVSAEQNVEEQSASGKKLAGKQDEEGCPEGNEEGREKREKVNLAGKREAVQEAVTIISNGIVPDASKGKQMDGDGKLSGPPLQAPHQEETAKGLGYQVNAGPSKAEPLRLPTSNDTGAPDHLGPSKDGVGAVSMGLAPATPLQALPSLTQSLGGGNAFRAKAGDGGEKGVLETHPPQLSGGSKRSDAASERRSSPVGNVLVKATVERSGAGVASGVDANPEGHAFVEGTTKCSEGKGEACLTGIVGQAAERLTGVPAEKPAVVSEKHLITSKAVVLLKPAAPAKPIGKWVETSLNTSESPAQAFEVLPVPESTEPPKPADGPEPAKPLAPSKASEPAPVSEAAKPCQPAPVSQDEMRGKLADALAPSELTNPVKPAQEPEPTVLPRTSSPATVPAKPSPALISPPQVSGPGKASVHTAATELAKASNLVKASDPTLSSKVAQGSEQVAASTPTASKVVVVSKPVAASEPTKTSKVPAVLEPSAAPETAVASETVVVSKSAPQVPPQSLVVPELAQPSKAALAPKPTAKSKPMGAFESAVVPKPVPSTKPTGASQSGAGSQPADVRLLEASETADVRSGMEVSKVATSFVPVASGERPEASKSPVVASKPTEELRAPKVSRPAAAAGTMEKGPEGVASAQGAALRVEEAKTPHPAMPSPQLELKTAQGEADRARMPSRDRQVARTQDCNPARIVLPSSKEGRVVTPVGGKASTGPTKEAQKSAATSLSVTPGTVLASAVVTGGVLGGARPSSSGMSGIDDVPLSARVGGPHKSGGKLHSKQKQPSGNGVKKPSRGSQSPQKGSLAMTHAELPTNGTHAKKVSVADVAHPLERQVSGEPPISKPSKPLESGPKKGPKDSGPANPLPTPPSLIGPSHPSQAATETMPESVTPSTDVAGSQAGSIDIAEKPSLTSLPTALLTIEAPPPGGKTATKRTVPPVIVPSPTEFAQTARFESPIDSWGTPHFLSGSQERSHGAEWMELLSTHLSEQELAALLDTELPTPQGGNEGLHASGAADHGLRQGLIQPGGMPKEARCGLFDQSICGLKVSTESELAEFGQLPSADLGLPSPLSFSLNCSLPAVGDAASIEEHQTKSLVPGEMEVRSDQAALDCSTHVPREVGKGGLATEPGSLGPKTASQVWTQTARFRPPEAQAPIQPSATASKPSAEARTGSGKDGQLKGLAGAPPPEAAVVERAKLPSRGLRKVGHKSVTPGAEVAPGVDPTGNAPGAIISRGKSKGGDSVAESNGRPAGASGTQDAAAVMGPSTAVLPLPLPRKHLGSSSVPTTPELTQMHALLPSSQGTPKSEARAASWDANGGVDTRRDAFSELPKIPSREARDAAAWAVGNGAPQKQRGTAGGANGQKKATKKQAQKGTPGPSTVAQSKVVVKDRGTGSELGKTSVEGGVNLVVEAPAEKGEESSKGDRPEDKKQGLGEGLKHSTINRDSGVQEAANGGLPAGTTTEKEQPVLRPEATAERETAVRPTTLLESSLLPGVSSQGVVEKTPPVTVQVVGSGLRGEVQEGPETEIGAVQVDNSVEPGVLVSGKIRLPEMGLIPQANVDPKLTASDTPASDSRQETAGNRRKPQEAALPEKVLGRPIVEERRLEKASVLEGGAIIEGGSWLGRNAPPRKKSDVQHGMDRDFCDLINSLERELPDIETGTEALFPGVGSHALPNPRDLDISPLLKRASAANEFCSSRSFCDVATGQGWYEGPGSPRIILPGSPESLSFLSSADPYSRRKNQTPDLARKSSFKRSYSDLDVSLPAGKEHGTTWKRHLHKKSTLVITVRADQVGKNPRLLARAADEAGTSEAETFYPAREDLESPTFSTSFIERDMAALGTFLEDESRTSDWSPITEPGSPPPTTKFVLTRSPNATFTLAQNTPTESSWKSFPTKKRKARRPSESTHQVAPAPQSKGVESVRKASKSAVRKPSERSALSALQETLLARQRELRAESPVEDRGPGKRRRKLTVKIQEALLDREFSPGAGLTLCRAPADAGRGQDGHRPDSAGKRPGNAAGVGSPSRVVVQEGGLSLRLPEAGYKAIGESHEGPMGETKALPTVGPLGVEQLGAEKKGDSVLQGTEKADPETANLVEGTAEGRDMRLSVNPVLSPGSDRLESMSEEEADGKNGISAGDLVLNSASGKVGSVSEVQVGGEKGGLVGDQAGEKWVEGNGREIVLQTLGGVEKPTIGKKASASEAERVTANLDRNGGAEALGAECLGAIPLPTAEQEAATTNSQTGKEVVEAKAAVPEGGAKTALVDKGSVSPQLETSGACEPGSKRGVNFETGGGGRQAGQEDTIVPGVDLERRRLGENLPGEKAGPAERPVDPLPGVLTKRKAEDEERLAKCVKRRRMEKGGEIAQGQEMPGVSAPGSSARRQRGETGAQEENVRGSENNQLDHPVASVDDADFEVEYLGESAPKKDNEVTSAKEASNWTLARFQMPDESEFVRGKLLFINGLSREDVEEELWRFYSDMRPLDDAWDDVSEEELRGMLKDALRVPQDFQL